MVIRERELMKMIKEAIEEINYTPEAKNYLIGGEERTELGPILRKKMPRDWRQEEEPSYDDLFPDEPIG